MTTAVTIGDATLYLGDCREILPTLGKVDAVVTDPPYGIGEATGKNKSRSSRAVSKDYGDDAWDDEPIDLNTLNLVKSAGRWQIIFGGNYYPMPPSSCWLIWDKLNGDNDFADCELAWTNMPKAVRRLQYRWHGMIRQNNEPRGDHPTQKPLGLMRWCLAQLPDGCRTILDPFMGSGTTGVAALIGGYSFIGIEREPRYFERARRRISEARSQPDMLIERPPEPKQEDMAI